MIRTQFSDSVANHNLKPKSDSLSLVSACIRGAKLQSWSVCRFWLVFSQSTANYGLENEAYGLLSQSVALIYELRAGASHCLRVRLYVPTLTWLPYSFLYWFFHSIHWPFRVRLRWEEAWPMIPRTNSKKLCGACILMVLPEEQRRWGGVSWPSRQKTNNQTDWSHWIIVYAATCYLQLFSSVQWFFITTHIYLTLRRASSTLKTIKVIDIDK